MSERRSYERRSECRFQFHEREVSAALFSNYERKKSGAHVFLKSIFCAHSALILKNSERRSFSAHPKLL